GGVVVGVGDRDVRRVHPVVDGIGAGGGSEHDAVSDRAVLDGVVGAGGGDRLGDIPVGGRECEAGRGGDAFSGVVARHRDGHVGGGLTSEHDLERGRAARLGGPEPRDRRDVDRGDVVVGIAGGDVRRVHAVVDRVRTGGGAEHDVVGDQAVLD